MANSAEQKGGLQPPTSYQIERFPTGKYISSPVLKMFREQNSAMALNFQTYEQYYRPHIDQSKEFIQDAAKGVTGDALILGVGNAMELPLGALARQFDSLTLVELDEVAVINSVQRLPNELQKKCKIVVEDMSGYIGNATGIIDDIGAGSKTFQQFIDNVTQVLPTLNPQPYAPEGKYNYVVSSLVTTQLASLFYEYITQTTLQKFRQPDPQAHPNAYHFAVALSQFAGNLQTQHFELLAHSVQPEGVAYWSDTTSRRFLERSPSVRVPYPVAPGELPMVDVNALSQNIFKRFAVAEERDWFWYAAPPAMAHVPTRGHGFGVQAAALLPLKN